jgi:hypothetical protein
VVVVVVVVLVVVVVVAAYVQRIDIICSSTFPDDLVSEGGLEKGVQQ